MERHRGSEEITTLVWGSERTKVAGFVTETVHTDGYNTHDILRYATYGRDEREATREGRGAGVPGKILQLSISYRLTKLGEEGGDGSPSGFTHLPKQ